MNLKSYPLTLFALSLGWFGPAVQGGTIRINELMYHPGYGKVGQAGYVPEDARKEYIELYNTGTNAVNLAGWRLNKAVSFIFTGATIEPQGYVVVTADSDINRFKESYRTNYPAVVSANVVGGWTGKLSDNGEGVELEDNLGQRVDFVAYASEGDWALRRQGDAFPGHPTWWRGWDWTTGADAGGKSLELVNPALANNSGQNWVTSLTDGGTPGGRNSVAGADIAPLILQVRHLPAIPKSTDFVTITARIIDELGPNTTVSLHHRLDGATAFVATPMLDDGQHGDGAAGDGVYGAVLPAQTDKAIAEFYVRASDAGGKTRTWPGPTDDQGTQGANALYQVDDSVYAGSQPIYRLIIPAAEWEAWRNLMDNVSDGRYSDAQMNATLVAVDGAGTEVRYNVGVRNRGKGTRAAHPHNLYVSIPGDRPWRNVTRLALNTRTVHSQVAANAIHSLAGLPNTYGAPVQVRINGANLAHPTPAVGDADSYQFGSYYCFQPYGSEWARDHFPEDSNGNLYKGAWYFDWVKLNNPADLDYLGDAPAAYRQAYSPSGPTADSGAYTKENNVAEDDWSDLVSLTKVLNNAPDATYTQDVGQVVNVDEWLRYIAVTALIGNMETTLGTGTGDDYSMYRGIVDPRFQILTHDLDTTLGQGDAGPQYGRSIFVAGGIPVLDRLLKHPRFAPRYYAILKELIDTTFSPAQINQVLDQWLGGWVPEGTIQSMKDFVVRRNAGVLAQIPLNLTAGSGLPMSNGYPRTTNNALSLNGNANAIHTRAVLVNGAPAAWTQWSASWSATGIALEPGVNRVVIQAMDGNGQEIERSGLDIWYDRGSTTPVAGGTLPADTTLTAAGGPYLLSSSLTIPAGRTLSVEPGTTVYLGVGVNLTVADGGRLLAQGTETQQIRFASPPGSGTSWGGITINGSVGSPETRLAYVFLEGNGNTCLEVAGGTLYLDHAGFGTTTHQYLSLDGASFVISDCVFPNPSAAFELAHGTGGVKSGGRGVFLRNFFGAPTGYNDVIDFTGGNRPGQPIVHFINNVFSGASDDHLDLDGTDAWIEGNIFLHAHKNGSPDTSSGVSGGNDSGQTSEVTIIGNIFYDCDQAAMAKQGNFFTLINNTIVHQTHQGGLDTDGAVVCVADEGTTEGRGMYLEGNIIRDAEKLVRNLTSATVTFTNNLMSLPWEGPGGANSIDDPRLRYIPELAETYFTSWDQAQVMRDWFSLRPGSPALGTGPNGRDQGGVIPLGASVSGEPTGTTSQTAAALAVGVARTGSGIPAAGWPNGSGYTHYKWRLDSGAWSAETPVTAPIAITGLANGPHYVEVIGKRDSGLYQDDPTFGMDAVVTRSRTWTVNTSQQPRVRLNEILADNLSAVAHGDGYPDLIELYNEGSPPVDLSGMGLSDDATNHYRFAFPAGTSLAGNACLVLYADNDDTTPGLHLGFALSRTGDAVYLYDKPASGGALLDSVSFGLQLADLSIGRLADGQWGLTKPTFGSANVPQPMGEPAVLRVNEWLTDAQSPFLSDFIELYNPDPLPVPLGGLFLTDNPVGWPEQHPIAALSFIAGNGFAAFIADAQPSHGADHLNFSLTSQPGMIGLFDAHTDQIDWVIYGSQQVDVSEGRSPNGTAELSFFSQPTPGAGNPGIPVSPTTTNITVESTYLIRTGSMWKFKDGRSEGSSPVSAWRGLAFNDGGWVLDPAPFSYGKQQEGVITGTFLNDMRNTYTCIFLRQAFLATNVSTLTNVVLNAVCDDGYIVWINGWLVDHYNVATNAITYNNTLANQAAPNPAPNVTTVLTDPSRYLVEGTNLMAVQVFNVSSTSSDLVFDVELLNSVTNVTVITNNVEVPIVLNEVLANNVSLTNAAGVIADWIELYNPGAQAVDLADNSLTDDIGFPRKWVFPPNSIIPALGYLVLQCDGDAQVSARNTGFGLEANGGVVYLFASANGGRLVDSVIYGLQVPDLSIGRAGSQGSWTLTEPTPGAPNAAAELGSAGLLKINEWMAKAVTGPDWFELFNPGSQPVDLSGLGLTVDLNNPTLSPVPPLSFIGTGANAYKKFIADKTPAQGANHVNFKLSAKGSSLGLFTANAVLVDAVTFGPQTDGVSQGRLPDGATTIVDFPTTATPGESNYQPIPSVVINEVLTHTDPPLEDAIEFYNPTATSQPVGGWYVSNTQHDFRKYRILDGTVVPAQGYLVLYEYQFEGGPGTLVPFTFNSAHGDEAWLSATDTAGNLTGLRAKADFGPAANGVSFGRYATSVGVDFVALSRPTFGTNDPAALEQFRAGKGAANAYPLVGPVVINEIMYHPPDVGGTNAVDNTRDEFIELLNLTAGTQPLFDPAIPTNAWKLGGGVDYTFPTDVALPGGGFLLLVSFDPVADTNQLAAFRTAYAVPEGVPIYGPYSGKLNNGGNSVELYKPDLPQQPPHPDAGFVPYLLVDRINYSNLTPWPTNADGTGLSLQRRVASEYGNDPVNCQAGAPTAGWANLSGGPMRIKSVELRAGQVVIRFTVEAGWTYTVQCQTALGNGAWQKLADVPAQATTRTLEVLDANASAGGERFYRLVTPAQP